jgi:cytoskeleton protein RodZ
VSEITETPVEEPQEPAQTAQTAQLGLLLREAREARGLSVADVVAALKFSPRQIEALEADQLDLLPGNVFVRGIVRGYARLLKLDPEPLLALLEDNVPGAPPDVKPLEDMGVAMPGASRQIPFTVVIAVLLAIAAAAAGIWHFLAPVPTVPVTAEQPLVQSPALVPMTGDAASPAASVPAAESQVTPPATAPETAVPEATATPSEPVAQVPQPTVVAGGKQLTFIFHGTSWVEVKDASQRIIFTGQFGPGSRQVVSGRPPFQIVVGNASDVELKYGDEPIDLAPHTRVEVARLTLK